MIKYRSFCTSITAILSVMATGLNSYAQTPAEVADSIMPEVTLSEVTVKASRVLHKSDMDVYVPSKNAIKVSQNGLSLLRNLRKLKNSKLFSCLSGA